MEDTRWRTWETAGLYAVLIAGNLMHFVYGWSGGNPVIAALAAVNESTWEHMKLLITPWIIWSLVSLLFQRGSDRPVAAARALGLLTGMTAIPVLYYTYRGATGQNATLVNVLIFQVAVLLACCVSYEVQKHCLLSGKIWQRVGVAVLLIVWFVTILWTFYPPAIPLFADPRTGLTGIPFAQ
ncbi:MAG: hypothetical protein J5482_03005 [Oscillospiraceae bacterium]|nr:hypothetical protein [Oscillospiraceae bacterium]